ncbi:MAG: PASTA domain-containing protein [Pseudomonadota bacterium]
MNKQANLSASGPGRKISSGLTAAFYLAVFLTALSAGAYLTAFLVVRGIPETTAPTLVGLARSDAEKIAGADRLSLRVDALDFNDEVPPDHVISQDPPAGSRLKENQAIRVVLSRGAQIVPAPDLRGLSLDQAVTILLHGRLAAGLISYTHGSGEPEQGPDRVIAQAPSPLAQVKAGSKIDLLLSLGPRPVLVSMPDLTGLSHGRAVLTLEKSGLVPGRIKADRRPDWPRETVLLQNPPPGGPTPQGTLVHLTVNRGAESEPGGYRFQVLEYRIPTGFLRREIKILVSGEDYSREVYQEWRRPGELVRVTALVRGAPRARFFEDGRETDRP